MLLCFWPFAFAQQEAPAPVAGIVEAEIGNGDLKPARFAQVVAMPTRAAADMRKAVDVVSSVVDDARAKAEEGPQRDMVELQCVAGMNKLKPAFVALKQAAVSDPSNSQGIVAADADEMGEFTLKGLTKQPYTVFATGKIGMNAAIWFVDLAPSEQSSRLKMARPQVTCYDPHGDYRP